MHYRLRDVPSLLRTPLGRMEALSGVYCHRAWPLLSRLASLHRRTLARNTRLVAVVGSFGKTTTTRAVMTALGGQHLPDLGFNSFSYVAGAILRIRPGDRHAVIEVGIARSGQMAGYARLLRPDVAVVTSIGRTHDLFLRTLQVTRAEKSQMVRILPPSGLAVLNGDDPNVRWMRGQTPARVRTFGVGEDNDVRASEVALDWPHGTRFTLHANGETRRVRVRLLGRHQVYSILAAVTVALAEGFSLDQVLPRLEALAPTPGRLDLVRLPNGALLLRDEFKAPEETIDVAFDVLAELPAQRRIVVLGDVADTLGSKRPIYRRLGERIGRVATRAIFIGEQFQDCAAGATRAGFPGHALVDAGTNALAAAQALKQDLKLGDVVLIKGRDRQRLDRVALALAGRQARCGIETCTAKSTRCDRCPMLERGWDGLRVVM